MLSVNDFSKKKSSASRNDSGLAVGSVFAKLARNEDSGRVLFATRGACKRIFPAGPKLACSDRTGGRSVTYAYIWSTQDNERMPGCNDDAARSPRKRLRRSCERCVPKFSKQNPWSTPAPMSVQRQQKEEQQRKKKAPKDRGRR